MIPPIRGDSRRSKAGSGPRIEALEGRHLLTTFMVTNAGSTGPNTLAAAIIASNADTAKPNVIDFDITGTGTQTIAVTAALPAITQPVTIDATTQPGYVANTGTTTDNEVPAVILDGTNAGADVSGLVFAPMAVGGEVEGLEVVRFSGDGIDIQANGVTVNADLIGVGAIGSAATPTGNGGAGIQVENAPSATISGTRIEGNAGFGVDLAVSQYAYLTNDTIGGTAGLGDNPGDGVRVDRSDGVSLTGVVVRGNAGIGVNVSGSGTLVVLNSTIQSNQGGGIALVDSDTAAGSDIADTTIGGATAALGNGVLGVLVSDSPGAYLAFDLVAGNAGPGIVANSGQAASVVAPEINFNTISGNAGDGLDVDHSTALSLGVATIQGNKGVGVSLADGSTAAQITAGTIGGTVAGQANGGIGLLVAGSDDLKLENTLIQGEAGFGVELERSDLASLTGVTVGGTAVLGANLGDGILSYLSRGLVLDNPTVGSNAGNGINLDQSADASIRGATIQLNEGFGVLVDESGSATISGSTVGGSVSAVSSDGGFAAPMANISGGILILGSTDATVEGDAVEGNRGDGVQLALGSTMARLGDDTISYNSGFGILDSASPMLGVGGAQVEDNQEAGVEIYDSPRALINTSSFGDPSGEEFADGIDVLGSDDVTIGATTSGGGNLISGEGGVGILLNDSTGASIENDDVTGNVDGLLANYANGLALANDTFSGSDQGEPNMPSALAFDLYNGLGSGLLIGQSAGISIAGVVVENNAADGIQLDSSDDAQISGVTVEANLGDGVHLIGSTGATLSGSTLDYQGGSGAKITAGSDDATLKADTISGNVAQGLVVLNSVGTTVED